MPETVWFKYRGGSANVTGLQAELEAAFRKLPIALLTMGEFRMNG